MDPQELEHVLTNHRVWVESSGREGTRADLRGADLQWADLQGANLRGADLREANLHGADLQGANLRSADLRGADLQWADLREANLREADLQWADLQGADLRGADLRGADLREADLREADLPRADLRCAIGIPVAVDAADRLRAVAVAATANDDNLRMDTWHTCQTTHCIAGWAVHLAGEPGRILEASCGHELAGRMLLGHEAALHFHDSNEDARAWLLSVLDS
jgi:hypothetical protein